MKTNTRLLRLLAVLLGLALVAGACGDDDTDTADPGATEEETTDGAEAAEGGTVTFAADQEPVGWNVNTSESALLITGVLSELVYPATFRITPEFEIAMNEDVLESAEMTSEEPQVVEYVINPDATWSDGTPITADDFEFQWMMQNGSNEDVDVASTVGYDRIESVEGSEDGKTVTVTFNQPYSEWRGLFWDMLPAHIISELGGGDAVEGWNTGLDGGNVPEFSGGPFVFTDYRPEQSVTLARNPDYWGDQANLDEIIVRFDVDNEGIPAALENEEIDMAYPQPQLDLVEQIDGIEGVETEINLGLQFEHIDFNLSNPHLAKQEVREAIALALDREDLVERTVGQFTDEAQVLNNRIYVNNQPEYEEHGEEYQTQNIEEARSLLESAGYTIEGDVYTHPEDGELSLRISTTGGNQLRENTQQVIQSQLAEAGIQIDIDNLEGSAVFSKFFPDSNELADQDYDIALFAWVSTPFASGNQALYTSENPDLVGQNNTGYQNSQVVDLFDQALSETDQDAATDLYNQVDVVLWEDLPTIPLYQKPTFFPFRSNISGVQDNASTAGPLWNADEWSLEEG